MEYSTSVDSFVNSRLLLRRTKMSKGKRDIKRKLRILNHAKRLEMLEKPAVILGFHGPFFINGKMFINNLAKKA